jgi:predicted Na+-dependent transporter
MLFFLIVGMSGSTRFKHVQSHLVSKNKILVGLGCQFFLLPFVAFIVVSSIPMSDIYKTMVLVVSTSPGGSYSNWLCSLYNADMPLSIAMTTVSTLASSFMMPLNMYFYSNLVFDESVSQFMDWAVFTLSLGLVIAGICLGTAVSYSLDKHLEQAKASDAAANNESKRRRSDDMVDIRVAPADLASAHDAASSADHACDAAPSPPTLATARTAAARKFGSTIRGIMSAFGNVCGISLIIFSAMMGQRKAPIWDREPSFFLGTACVFLFALVLPLYLTRFFHLSHPERITVAIEASYQNVGLATSLALNMYNTDDEITEAVGIPLVYGFWEMSFLTIFCLLAWKANWTYCPANASFWEMISGDFQDRNRVAAMSISHVEFVSEREEDSEEVVGAESENDRNNNSETMPASPARGV